MTPTIVRLTAIPRLLNSGATSTLRMAGGGNRSSYYFGGNHWRAGVVDLPRFSVSFGWDENGWNGNARPQIANLVWSPSVFADVATYANNYLWKDAPITAELGLELESGSAGDGPELLTGAPTTGSSTSWNSGTGTATASSETRIVAWSGVLTVGQTYHARFDYNMTSGSKLRIGNGASNGVDIVYVSGILSGSGTIDIAFVATNTSFAIEADSAVYSGTLSNISCKLSGGAVGSVEPTSWTSVLTGKVQQMASASGQITLQIADNGATLDQPLVSAFFAGTGGVEGPAEAEGREKRQSYGYVFNVEGRILDKVNNIWEFGDPAQQLQAISAVRDIGRAASPTPTSVAWAGNVAATFAALQAASPVAGSGVVAPSIGCVKWWTQPVGPLTADLIGAGDYGNTACALAKHLVVAAGLTMNAVPGSVSSLMANVANAGVHVGDTNMTVANALDKLLLGAGLFWRFSPAGALDVYPIQISSPTETIVADNIQRKQVFAPHRKRLFGYAKNERQMSPGSNRQQILANPRDAGRADFCRVPCRGQSRGLATQRSVPQ
jgi:hypothetical protein